MVWESNLSQDLAQLQITGAVLPIKDKIIVGASGGDRGICDWIAALDAITGKQLWLKYTIPAPGEPGSESGDRGGAEPAGAVQTRPHARTQRAADFVRALCFRAVTGSGAME